MATPRPLPFRKTWSPYRNHGNRQLNNLWAVGNYPEFGPHPFTSAQMQYGGIHGYRGCVPRRRPWVPGYWIKIGVAISFLGMLYQTTVYPQHFSLWMRINISPVSPSLLRSPVSRRSGWTSPQKRKKKEKKERNWAVSRVPNCHVHIAPS